MPEHRYFPTGAGDTGTAFVTMDRLLDQAVAGPLYLARPEIADLVVATLLDGQDVHHLFILHAFVVMPNHVHLLLTPKAPVPKLMQGLKGPTARRSHQILKRTGRAFWQEESYDHGVRDEREFGRIRAYIEENPVRAGWVAVAQDYRWSSAWLTAQTEPG